MQRVFTCNKGAGEARGAAKFALMLCLLVSSCASGAQSHLIQGTCGAYYYGSATFWIHIDMFP